MRWHYSFSSYRAEPGRYDELTQIQGTYHTKILYISLSVKQYYSNVVSLAILVKTENNILRLNVIFARSRNYAMSKIISAEGIHSNYFQRARHKNVKLRYELEIDTLITIL